MYWEDIPETVDSLVLKVAAPAFDIRQLVSNVLTNTDIGYYYHPGFEKVAIYAPQAADGDLFRTKAVAERAVGKSNVRSLSLNYQELNNPYTSWIKVAYSPTLRRMGEYLNFFPGQYPGGVPNHPSPVAAMLTSGLVGAGLGYGAGTLLGKLLPERYGNNLGKTGLILGSTLGALPGLGWGMTNKLVNKNFNSPELLDNPPDKEVQDYPDYINGMDITHGNADLPANSTNVNDYLSDMAQHIHKVKHSVDEGLKDIKLSSLFKQACIKTAQASSFAEMPVIQEPTPFDVNINALGQTLYNQGASPNLAATTMSAMYAAQQLPDQRSSPGWATFGQLGQLARNMAGDYTKGLLAGAAINTVIGTPYPATTFGAVNAGLGILGTVIPKLFSS